MAILHRVASCSVILTILFLPVFMGIVSGHVPYLEHRDFTQRQPFEVRKTIDQSIAVYAWLENDGMSPCEDIDVYTFDVPDSTRIYLEVIVPVCPAYEEFVPWFALAGPGLPAPSMPIPFNLPRGYGAIIMENFKPGEDREKFYEPFGGKWYYVGPIFDEIVEEPGTYYVYYWDPHNQGGDYVAVLGWREQFGFWDIIRALINTPLIRKNLELHTDCGLVHRKDLINLQQSDLNVSLYREVTHDLIFVGSQ